MAKNNEYLNPEEEEEGGEFVIPEAFDDDPAKIIQEEDENQVELNSEDNFLGDIVTAGGNISKAGYDLTEQFDPVLPEGGALAGNIGNTRNIDKIIYDSAGGDDLLTLKEREGVIKRGGSDDVAKRIGKVSKDEQLVRVFDTQKNIDKINAAKTTTGNTLGEFVKNASEAIGDDPVHKKALGKSTYNAYTSVINEVVDPEDYSESAKRIRKQLMNEANEYLEKGITLKGLDNVSRDIKFPGKKNLDNLSVPAEARSELRKKLRQVVRNELKTYLPNKAGSIDAVYEKWGGLKDLLDRKAKLLAKGDNIPTSLKGVLGKVKQVSRKVDVGIRKYADKVNQSVDNAIDASKLGKYTDDALKYFPKPIQKLIKKHGLKAIPVAGALIGGYQTYKEAGKQGLDFAPLRALLATGGYLLTDLLDFGGPIGFAANVAADVAIENIALIGEGEQKPVPAYSAVRGGPRQPQNLKNRFNKKSKAVDEYKK